MPHLLLEHSANIAHAPSTTALFQRLHQVLIELAGSAPTDLKSRRIAYEDYLVGEGTHQDAFVHLCVSLLSGRDISVRQRIKETCLALLIEAFVPKDNEPTHLQPRISVEVREMERATYGKYPAVVPTSSPS